MAASSSTSGFGEKQSPLTTADPEKAFQSFYTEVKEIEKRDSVLTSTQQIDRLLRPGSTYFNLNPFEVSSQTTIETDGMGSEAEQSSGCLLKTHQFSARISELDIHFSILQLKDSFFLWIGSNPIMSELAVAMPSRFDKTPISTKLIGCAKADSVSNILASHLARRTAKQVFVSYSVDSRDEMIVNLIEQRLIAELKSHPEKF